MGQFKQACVRDEEALVVAQKTDSVMNAARCVLRTSTGDTAEDSLRVVIEALEASRPELGDIIGYHVVRLERLRAALVQV